MRDLIITKKFGIGSVSDEFQLLLTMPDLVNNLLSVTTISYFLIPLVVTERYDDFALVKRIKEKLLIVTIFVSILFLIIFYILYPKYVFLLLLISYLSIYFNVQYATDSSYLNSKNDFGLTSLGTLFYSLPIVVYLFFFGSISVFPLIIVLASFIRYIIIVNGAKVKMGLHSTILNRKIYNISYSEIIIPIITSGVFFIIPIIDRIFASKLLPGDISIVVLSDKLLMFPISIILTPIAIAAYPNISRTIMENRRILLNGYLLRIIGIILVISLLISLAIVFFSKVGLIYIHTFINIELKKVYLMYQYFVYFIGYIIFSGLNLIVLNIMFSLNLKKELIRLVIIILLLKVFSDCFLVYLNLSVVYFSLFNSLLSVIQFFASLILMKRYLSVALRYEELKVL